MVKRSRIYLFLRGALALGIILVGIVGANGVQGAIPVPPFCTNPFKLMPLGDSITVGKYSGDEPPIAGTPENDIGYRKDLKDLLTGPEYDVDFVGEEVNGQTYPFDDPEHQGINGIKANQVRVNLFGSGGNWLEENPPDVILLHIGTNDINSTQPVPEIVDEVKQILDTIDSYQASINPRKDVIVILALIIDQDPHKPRVTDFNNQLESMVKLRSEFRNELFLVDMEDGAGIDYSNYSAGGDMYDKNHPYATGFYKMAEVWKAKIDGICRIIPQLIPPGNQINKEGDEPSLTIETSGPNGYPLTFIAEELPPGLSIDSSGSIEGIIQDGSGGGPAYESKVTIKNGALVIDWVDFDWIVNITSNFYVPLAIKR